MRWFFASLVAFLNLFLLHAQSVGDISPAHDINIIQQAQATNFLPKVDPVTGEYYEKEIDLVVAGSEPISLSRFYNHMAPPEDRWGLWRLNPESQIGANFEYEKRPRFAAVGGDSGGVVCLETLEHRTIPSWIKERVGDSLPETVSSYRLSGEHEGRYMNISNEIGAASYPRNTIVYFWHSNGTSRFHWSGVVQDGSGRIREFDSAIHEWHDKKEVTLTPPKYIGHFPPEFWTPYVILVKRTILPNGNIIRYTPTQWRTEKYWPRPRLLGSIAVWNNNETIKLAEITLHYNKYTWKFEQALYHPRARVDFKEKLEDGASFTAIGSDKRAVHFDLQRRQRDLEPVLLRGAHSPSSHTHYNYHGQKLIEVDKGNGRRFLTEYEPETHRVKAQYAPIGPQGGMVPVAQFLYSDRCSEVVDGENGRTIYRYDANKRITAIESYLQDELCSIDRSVWDENGCLISSWVEDAQGHILRRKDYKYDDRGNVLEEAHSGLQGEPYTIYRTYSDDGLNLKLSEGFDDETQTIYTYKPGTNLLASEIFYKGEEVKKRLFREYDDCAICVRMVLDDGCSLDPHDLKGVTYRKIEVIKPRDQLPCFGLPERREIRTIDADGQEILLNAIEYLYHPSGQVEQERHFDCKNRFRYVIEKTYNSQELLASSTNALRETIHYTYDSNSNPISRNGPRTDMHREWVYDLANRPIEEHIWQSNGSVLVKKMAYDNMGRLISLIDPCTHETTYTYDTLGRLIATHHPDGAIQRKTYDALGNLIKEIDPNGYETRYEYNFKGEVTARYYPDGSEEHFTYHPHRGTLTTHVDRNGAKMVYTYDACDHPIKIETFDGEGNLLRQTSATYSPFNKLSETDAKGVTTYYSYDFAGRKISEKKGERLTTFEYDALWRLTRTTSGDTEHIQLHDLKGQVIEKRIENREGKLLFQERYAYDASGNKTDIETCLGRTRHTYDSENRLLKTVDPSDNTTTYSHTFSNQYTRTTTNPKNVQTVEAFDALGRLTDIRVYNPSSELISWREKIYDPVGNQTTAIEHIFVGTDEQGIHTLKWIYGPLGRIESMLEAGRRETIYGYDSHGHLIVTYKPDGTEIHTAYDSLGRLSCLSTERIDYHYLYDRRDRLIEVNEPLTSAQTHRVYDIYGNLTEEHLSNGIVLKSDYNPYGQRKALHLPDSTSAYYTYSGPYLSTVSRGPYTHRYSRRNLAGFSEEIDLPKELGKITLSWDPQLRLKTLRCPYFDADYRYDSSGNLETYSFKDPIGHEACSYTYDFLDQLTSENGNNYTYDSLYNRTEKNGATYIIDTLNQLETDQDREYTYDLNGNLISDSENTYTYDALDRLISIESDRQKITYTYDPFNRRVAKNDEHYIWDHKKEIGMSRRGYLQQLRILGEGLGAEIGAGVIYEIDGYTYFPIHNHQGSLVTLIYASGEYPYGTYRYTAFGEPLTPETYSPWRFASKRHDRESGLIYFGRRYYNPSLGRWITPDPLGYKDGPNLYAYVHNAPLNSIDPHGLMGLVNMNYARYQFRNSFRTLSYNSQDFHYRLRGAGIAAKDIGLGVLSRMGGRVLTMRPTIFDPSPMYGQWNGLALGNPADYPQMMFRTALPYTYDLQHLSVDTPRHIQCIAQGRSLFEIGVSAFGVTKLGQIAANPLRGISASSKPLAFSQNVSREYLYSGRPSVVDRIASGRQKNWLKPNLEAEGAHSVIRRDPSTGRVSHYATYKPQTNPYDPKPWELVSRFDNPAIPHYHFNRVIRERVYTPHVHDPHYPGGVRFPQQWEIP